MKKTKRKNNLKKNGLFRESFNYIRESRKFIYLVIGLFAASGIIGFVFSDSFTAFDELIRELALKVEGLNLYELIWFIFQNNVLSSFSSMIFGVFLGIFSVFNSMFNGVLLGYVYSRASEVGGLGIFWRLLPHGVFELPAIFISLGLGVRLGMFVFTREKKKEFFYRFKNSLKVFLAVVLPLLAAAAVIEGVLIGAGG